MDIRKLKEELPKSFILTRKNDGLEYIAGYQVIDQANSIFGFGNWGYRLTRYPELHESKDVSGIFYYFTCAVETWVKDGASEIRREDVGYAEVTSTKIYDVKDQNQRPTGEKRGGRPQFEVAFKGCVTDAMKRALRAWGNQFGNSLYDREDKLPTMEKESIGVDAQKELSTYVQQIMDCQTVEQVEEVLNDLVQIAIQDEWTASQKEYIKGISERVKKGIKIREQRKSNNSPQEAKSGASEVVAQKGSIPMPLPIRSERSATVTGK